MTKEIRNPKVEIMQGRKQLHRNLGIILPEAAQEEFDLRLWTLEFLWSLEFEVWSFRNRMFLDSCAREFRLGIGWNCGTSGTLWRWRKRRMLRARPSSCTY